MKIGGFPKNQSQTSDTKYSKKIFFTARASQVNVTTMKRIFKQRSELLIIEGFIIHGPSSSYNVSRVDVRSKPKGTQQWWLCVANDSVFNQVRVYHERVYADNVLSNFWFVSSFSSQHISKFIANNNSQNVSQVRTNECKTRSFLCNVNLKFLSTSRHSNCDTVFAVFVSFFNEIVCSLNKIRNGRVKTSFQISNFPRLWKLLIEKHDFPSVTFWYIDG